MSWFIDKINKIDSPFNKLTKYQRETIPVNKTGDEKGDITIDTKGIQRTISICFKNLYSKLGSGGACF